MKKKKEKKTIKFQLRMAPHIYKKLKEIAEKQGRTMSELIRQALTEFLEKQKEVKK